MKEEGIHLRLVAALLLVSALRTLFAAFAPPPADLADPIRGAPLRLPDLAHDGWVPLSWLPGIGPKRARAVVRLRAGLGVELTPERLVLIPGIDAGTAQEVRDWYRSFGRAPPVGG